MEHSIKKFIEATDFTFIPSEKVKVHVFKVKPTDEAVMKLVETGFFDGTEKFIRKTTTASTYSNGKKEWCNHIYTIIRNDGSSYSWESGSHGHTCISEKTSMEGEILNGAIDLLLN